jgi:hypothetical protein
LYSIPRPWTRSQIAWWIVKLVNDSESALIGIDHGFSMSDERYTLYAQSLMALVLPIKIRK